MLTRCTLLGVLLLAGTHGVLQAGEPQEAVTKSLAYLGQDAVRWKEKYNCATCHHVPMMVWSFREARQAGYAINDALLDEMTTWLLNDSDARVIPDPAKKSPYINGLETAPVITSLAMWAMPEWDDATRQAWNKMADHVASKQQEDGSFITSMGRPPIFGMSEVMTAYAVLVLSPPEREVPKLRDVTALRAKSLAWLARTPTDGAHQSLVLRLLVQLRSGGAAEETRKLTAQLIDRQSASGGWSQTSEMEPDALATGQSLYVLRSAGVPTDAPAIQRGVAFLVKTQAPDGTWPMSSRPVLPGSPSKEVAKEERAEYQIPITYYGTAWATMGIVRSVPASK